MRPPGTVSVIVPCYNAAPFVGEAIDSALAQGWPAVEVIVVDDASTDGSWEVIAGYGDRVRAVRLPANRGGAHARNRGADLASGDWLLFLDADDLLEAHALETMVETAERSPGALVACGWRYLTSRDGGGWVPGPAPRPPRAAGADPLLAWLRDGWCPPCALLWPRAVWERTGGWDESLTLHDDGDLAMRALAAGVPLARTEGNGAFYRRHGPGRATVSGGRSPAAVRSGLAVLDRVSSTLAAQGRLDRYRAALAVRYADLAQLAFQAGHRELGRECLARAGAGSGRGTPARTLPGRLLILAFGLERKERILAALRRLRTAAPAVGRAG
ncbi:MAG TPA: glycosyltransferase [Longimicrobium sp.]|jgi:hypothetical protein